MTIRDLINSIINILNSILDIKIESVLGVFFCIGGILLGGFLSRLYFQHYDAAESETKEIKEFKTKIKSIFFIWILVQVSSLGFFLIASMLHLLYIFINIGLIEIVGTIISIICLLFCLLIVIKVFLYNIYVLIREISFKQKNRKHNFFYIIEYILLMLLYTFISILSLSPLNEMYYV